MTLWQALNKIFKADLLKQLPTFQIFERKLFNENLCCNITHGKVFQSNISVGRITVIYMIHHISHKKNSLGLLKWKTGIST